MADAMVKGAIGMIGMLVIFFVIQAVAGLFSKSASTAKRLVRSSRNDIKADDEGYSTIAAKEVDYSNKSYGQQTMQRVPDARMPTIMSRTPPIDAKPTMNNLPPVNAMPSIAIESSQQLMQEIEDRLYEQIAKEIETNSVDKGIWTKTFAQSGGDDKLTRVAYIKARIQV